ncbi:conserved protein of unknown function [Ruminococcaceae bacterium BL-6]|nr:conserved protein of unknown function [Ruminococcaceae bacterium BL-6]
MGKGPVYLGTYVLQQDMRIRMPKSILTNLSAEKGKTRFVIYLDSDNQSLILKVADDAMEDKFK